jgi:predicted transcriptional regulator
MNKNTTIKVSKSTLEKLHKLAGVMASEKGKRVTLEEAINKLIEEKYNKKDEKTNKFEEDRKNFLILIDQKISGGQPEDFKEYNYNDMGTL